MAVYLSLSPKTSEARTPDALAGELAGIGFRLRRAWVLDGDHLREIVPGSEAADRIEMLDDRNDIIDLERSLNFSCGSVAWWCMSWGCGAAAYEAQLRRLLDLADRLGWDLRGNSGKLVSRENLPEEVADFAGVAPQVGRMLGTQAPLDPRAQAERDQFNAMLDELIIQCLEKRAASGRTGEAVPLNPDDGRDCQ
jgi:hypothetical protein